MFSSSEVSAIELLDVSCARAGVDGQSADSLRGLNASFVPRTFSIITGPALSERTLLLRLLSLSDAPDSGVLLIEGTPTQNLDTAARAVLRARRIGMVFSAPFLLPAFSAIENIAMPLFKLEHVEPDDARARAEAALAFVGLSGCEQNRGEDLTRSQQHGVSLARALAARPGILLIEEVDSLLEGDALQQFTGLLRQAAEQFALAVVATASPELAPACAPARLLRLDCGTIGHDSAHLREPFS